MFRYLRHVGVHVENNVPEMRRNIQRACNIWKHLSKVLVTKEVLAPVAGIVYHVAVVVVLLCGSKLLSLPPWPLNFLEGFPCGGGLLAD